MILYGGGLPFFDFNSNSDTHSQHPANFSGFFLGGIFPKAAGMAGTDGRHDISNQVYPTHGIHKDGFYVSKT